MPPANIFSGSVGRHCFLQENLSKYAEHEEHFRNNYVSVDHSVTHMVHCFLLAKSNHIDPQVAGSFLSHHL